MTTAKLNSSGTQLMAPQGSEEKGEFDPQRIAEEEAK
jgi:hypothetical protein